MTISQSFTINDLKTAFEQNQFILHYQPQFNVLTESYDGVEALIRWHHPTQGLLSPSDFIATAELDGDFTIVLGEWILQTACQQMKQWQQKGYAPLRMAVNIFDKQCRDHHFVDFVIGLLHKCELAPQVLELELSENIIIDENDNMLIQAIERLHKLGVLIALDDFGVGHIQPDHLGKIPVDRIKIDKSHIRNILENTHDADLVRSYISIAEQRNIQIVAEGVETLMQLQLLMTHECREIQGFYFSQPLPAVELEVFLAKNSQSKNG